MAKPIDGYLEPIDFYFDFSSPYGYFAAAKIDEIAARHLSSAAAARSERHRLRYR